MKKYIDADKLRNDILECKRKIPPGFERHNAMVQALAVIDHQPAVQLVDIDDIIRDLKRYAEVVISSGEVKAGQSILTAAYRLKQTTDKNE